MPVMSMPQVPDAPEPVVEGTDKLERAVAASEAFVPPLAIGRMPETCEVRLTADSEPPRVSEPVEVTVPDSVRPCTVPVPDTEVTPSGVEVAMVTKSVPVQATSARAPAAMVVPVVAEPLTTTAALDLLSTT